MINDELLRVALAEALSEDFERYSIQNGEKPHRFSLAYKLRKRSVFRFAKRSEEQEPHTERKYMPLRRLALVMAVIAAAVVLSLGVYAAYVMFINGFVFDVYRDHSEVTFDPSTYEIKDTITEYYLLPPESGCEYVNEMLDDIMAVVEYQLNGRMLLLIQSSDVHSGGNYVVNTENAELYEASVNGNDGFIIITHKENEDDSISIYWVMDGYLFEISTVSLSNDELIQLAETVRIRD